MDEVANEFFETMGRAPTIIELAKRCRASTSEAKLFLSTKVFHPVAAPQLLDEEDERDYSFLEAVDDKTHRLNNIKHECTTKLRRAYNQIKAADPYAQPTSKELKLMCGSSVTNLQALDFLRELKK